MSAVGVSRPRRQSVRIFGGGEFGNALVVGALLLWLAFRDGGYFPSTWDVGVLALLWLVVVVLLWRAKLSLGRHDALFLIALGGLALWTWLSVLWSIAPGNSVLEGQRTLLYVSGGGALLLVGSRTGARTTVLAVLVAIAVVCGYALADRLIAVSALPYHRLGGPVGYWNSLGILAVAGVCLALAVVAHEPRPLARAGAGAVLPLLVGALYLTFSRGSWLALGVGVAALAAIDSGRRQLVASAATLAVPCVAVIVGGVTAHALTTPGAPRSAVAADAHRLALVVLLMCAASAALAIRAPRLSARLPRVPTLPVGRIVASVLACTILIAAIAAGGPSRLVGAAGRAFAAAPPSPSGDPNARLVSLSGSDRADYWRVAVTTFASEPLVGNGAGTFDRLWLMKRRTPSPVQDAHSLYLETLTELGTVGLALLVAVLVVPLIAARRVVSGAYIPALTAVYVVFVMHAAVDWDWEMPVVTITELACGAALITAARDSVRPVRRGVRIGGVVAALGLAGCTLVFLIGNRDLSAAAAAAASGQNTLQARARAAQRWVPWSPDPLRWLATIQLNRGHRPAARRLLAAALARDRTDWSLWMEMAAASDGPARNRDIITAIRLDPRGPELLQAAVRYGLISRHRGSTSAPTSHHIDLQRSQASSPPH